MSDVIVPMTEESTAASGGEIVANILPAPLGPPAAHFDFPVNGVADITFGVQCYNAGRFKTTDIAEIPFIGDGIVHEVASTLGAVPRQHLRGTALAEPEPKDRAEKYECVYLNAWETGSEAKAGVGKWIAFYNRKRPNSDLGGPQPWSIG